MNKSRDLARLPAVQKVVELMAQSSPSIKTEILTEIIRSEIKSLREALRTGEYSKFSKESLTEIVIQKTAAKVAALTGGCFRKVINATGIVLHTGLGRAPYGKEMTAAIGGLLSGYVNLEFDLGSGERGERLDLVDEQLRLLTGAESSAIVNNNAAAVLLALNSLADGKEVIVSRGELIEIGGSFRLPDVMQKSGAKMVEVGTTNHTHLSDYKKAHTRRTAAILLAHSSNYRIEGFTTKPEASEIISWAHSKHLPVIYDLGSGALFPMESAGLPFEPVVSEVVRQGFDVVTFSGDKLLGGPQAGLIVGRKKYIEILRRDPLMRALRCDKTVFALLSYTLSRYLVDQPLTAIETYNLLTADPVLLKHRANAIIEALDPKIVKTLNLTARESLIEAGSGSMPTAQIPSAALVAIPQNISETHLARLFRSYNPPIIGYCKNGEFWLDLKAVESHELPIIQTAIRDIGLSLLSKS